MSQNDKPAKRFEEVLRCDCGQEVRGSGATHLEAINAVTQALVTHIQDSHPIE